MTVSRFMEWLQIRKTNFFLLFVVLIVLTAILFPQSYLWIPLTIALIVGWLISLAFQLILHLSPSLRNTARSNRKIQWALLVSVTCIGAVTLFMLNTYFTSYSTVVFYELPQSFHPNLSTWQDAPSFEDFQSERKDQATILAMAKEVWLHQIAFPAQADKCYSTDYICELVSKMMNELGGGYPGSTWSDYLRRLGANLLLALPGTVLAWYSIRPADELAKKPKQ